jgi:peptidoglycan/xylan/chitin deacetylase (PgdA/CDA1 family)
MGLGILPMSIITKPGHRWLAMVMLALLACSPFSQALADGSAVVLMYHRFAESEYPSTNTTVEQLDAHIAELSSGAYTVLPLPEIVERTLNGPPLPDRTVGISIDDAYRSIYTVAWPKLKAAGLPFTVFVATKQVDRGSSTHMTWDQLRDLAANGVTIGHHTVSHHHMATASPERNQQELTRAFRRFEDEVNQRPTLFAYPYGEAALAVSQLITDAGFLAAFGQHSGVIGSIGDMFYLPRFAMNEKYGGIDRFRLAVNALPIPVTDVTPLDHIISEPNPPAMGFTVQAGIGELGQLNCFVSHAGRADLERLGPNRIEVRITKAFPVGRSRLNCTLPAGKGRWRWLGRQFYRAP